MKYVKGDLLQMFDDGEFDVIVHGCNCFCRMRSGIAGQISKRYPQAVELDNKTTPGDKHKLGTVQIAIINGKSLVNAYTQYRYGTEKRHVDYDAIRSCFKRIHQKFGRKMGRNLRIGIPKIGCGLAGGSWDIVEEIINEEMAGDDVTCVELSD